MFSKPSLMWCVVSVLWLMFAMNCLASTYAIVDLGSLGNDRPLRAKAINNLDQIVGNAEFLGAVHPFLWKNGVISDMGVFGSSMTYADDINDVGQVVGYGNRAFIWEDDEYTDLGTLGGTYYWASAHGINEASQVVGSCSTGDPKTNPVLWENGEIIDLGGWGDRQLWL